MHEYPLNSPLQTKKVYKSNPFENPYEIERSIWQPRSFGEGEEFNELYKYADVYRYKTTHLLQD